MKKLYVLLAVLFVFGLSTAALAGSMSVVSDGDEDGVVLTDIAGPWAIISGAYWIWTLDSSDIPEPATATFLEDFEVKGVPNLGELEITADNEFTVYLNNKFIGEEGGRKGVFKDTYVYDVSNELKPNHNILKVVGKNRSYDDIQKTSYAGVIYKLDIEYSGRCNNGVGNGSEGCNPGNSPNNDEDEEFVPGNPGMKGGK